MNQIPKTVALFALRGYRWAISPMFLPACRYVPSCSEYAIEAVDRYGVARGSVMAIWRVLRCNPWSKGGVDLVIKTEMISSDRSNLPVQCGRAAELCGH